MAGCTHLKCLSGIRRHKPLVKLLKQSTAQPLFVRSSASWLGDPEAGSWQTASGAEILQEGGIAKWGLECDRPFSSGRAYLPWFFKDRTQLLCDVEPGKHVRKQKHGR
ncbi:hypothetical protein NDU88_004254 [Pleurodeles waltl]|uniref:Uncharacterized protein n=1 Tax=Pleurodeles waltl TaxID=8319 RepID=A0AAV7UIK7_PLEWA|nr:hypothetical protein NDU88_004254 [Pleurodeles waltl]